VQTKSSFNVIGPGGSAYFFRRTCGLPANGSARPARIPASVPVDPHKGEIGYIMRKKKAIWGFAEFNAALSRWIFISQQTFDNPLSDNVHFSSSIKEKFSVTSFKETSLSDSG
jgi:hypothetical protein